MIEYDNELRELSEFDPFRDMGFQRNLGYGLVIHPPSVSELFYKECCVPKSRISRVGI